MSSGDRTDPFRCRRCGACCRWPGYVYLTPRDITGLARHLWLEEETFIRRYTQLAPNRGQLALADGAEAACVFLDHASSCRVYEARPVQCRAFPEVWDAPGGCPGREHAGPQAAP